MTREEAKELLPIIQAFTEGKTIEFKNCYGNWVNCGNALIPGFHKDFRIKPGPKYRPFKDADECWQEMLKHEPFGWVKEKERNVRTQIGFMHTKGIQSTNDGSSNYKAFFDCFNFADGTPFGVKVG